MEVKGRIKAIDDMINVSAAFQKRQVVVTTEEQYPQHIAIEFTQDKCDLLNQFSVGQEVSISINLRGREWVNPQGETRYFNSIQGWRIASVQPAHHAGNPTNQAPANQAKPQDFTPSTNLDEPDDLPF